MREEILNENIHVNQIGYRSKDKKIAIINGKGQTFEVIDDKSGKVVYSGDLTRAIFDECSGDTVSHADFTDIDAAGTYHMVVHGLGRSFSFQIKEHVYKDIKNALIKGLYYQRCGTALEEKYAGPWKHEACHLQAGCLYEDHSKMIDGTGGWHDAGDYGKYTVPGAYAAAYMLIAYELMPSSFGETLNIPESGNGVPDILNETRFELEWLLKMQDKDSGGVYGKFTSKTFPDNLDKDSKGIMPEDDKLDLYFFPVASNATADFAAVMGLAARVYHPFDKDFSDICLESAERAWSWLTANKEIVCPRNTAGVVTGEYWDDNDKDERYWAAAELYRTTGKKEYHDYIKNIYKEIKLEYSMWWREVGGLGSIAYLFTAQDRIDKVIYEEIMDAFFDHANKLLESSKVNGYRLPLSKNHYIWGSNLLVMNAAFYLIVANLIKPDRAYIEAAQGHMDYLLGCNAVNYCYVTGFGSKPVKYPHHRPSVADGVEEAVPGLVSGGPNTGLQDEYAKKHLTGSPPARCFIDNDLSYATNEIAIYWNTPAVFVAGYFDSE